MSLYSKYGKEVKGQHIIERESKEYEKFLPEFQELLTGDTAIREYPESLYDIIDRSGEDMRMSASDLEMLDKFFKDE